MKEKQLHCRISEDIYELLQQQAENLNLNKSEYLTYLIEQDVKKTVSDTSSILFHYEELKRQVNRVDSKVEELGQLFLAYFTAFFRTQPPLDEEGESILDWQTASDTTVKWLTVHRNKLREDNKPFMYRIFGSMLEVDGTFNTKDTMEEDYTEK